MLKQVEPLVQTPEQILQSLELEISLRRHHRQSGQRRRVAVLAAGLLLIVGGTVVALFTLFSTLSNVRHADAPRENTAAFSSQ